MVHCFTIPGASGVIKRKIEEEDNAAETNRSDGRDPITAAHLVDDAFGEWHVYQRLESGAEGAQSTFAEPGTTPGTVTIYME